MLTTVCAQPTKDIRTIEVPLAFQDKHFQTARIDHLDSLSKQHTCVKCPRKHIKR